MRPFELGIKVAAEFAYFLVYPQESAADARIVAFKDWMLNEVQQPQTTASWDDSSANVQPTASDGSGGPTITAPTSQQHASQMAGVRDANRLFGGAQAKRQTVVRLTSASSSARVTGTS